MKFRRDWVESLKTAENMDIEEYVGVELETVRLFVSHLCQSPERMKQFLGLVEKEMKIVEAKKKEKES